jgi:hypothetical protein
MNLRLAKIPETEGGFDYCFVKLPIGGYSATGGNKMNWKPVVE